MLQLKELDEIRLEAYGSLRFIRRKLGLGMIRES